MISFRRFLRVPQELRPSEIFKQDSLSPSKISLQIVLLQIFYYLTACSLFYCWAKLCGYELELKKWLFSWELIDFTNSFGITMCIIWLMDSLICVLFLTVIVGRSKLAWDFAITIHAINLITVLLYTHKWPSFAWFLLQLLSSLILVFLGTWSTRWRELRDTFFEGLVDQPIESQSNLVHSKDPIEMKDLEAQK
ncbi:LAFE_0A06260g1_1 [Lachancea fermentati]|uniref:LAFE_0A06260g1_1 n=1 Tax=Lachancea fermentati TaxID=4955 RepID=A0A1G4M6W5_LACFM|nr:LAFE_0A06260g1_1 [Lachancea fermentati]